MKSGYAVVISIFCLAALSSAVRGGGDDGAVSGGPTFSNTGNNVCFFATTVDVPVGPAGSPTVVTILGNNSPGATGSDCIHPSGDQVEPTWWEAFRITQRAKVTIDLCETAPVQDPSYNLIYRNCTAGGNFCTNSVSSAQSGRGAPVCADGNIWSTFINLDPGTYRIPLLSDPGVLTSPPGPYEMHISASACPGSCCHTNEHTCDDCAEAGTCTGPGDEFHANESCVQVECGAVIGPDTMVGYVWDCTHLGRVGNIGEGTVAMSCNTTACNIGDMRGDWIALPDTNHPVIGVNLYRSESVAGSTRFEQIGQGWLKHGFGSSNADECGFGCMPGAPFEQIGVGCSDTYLGLQFESCNLGPRSMIHPYTGVMPGGPDMGNMSGCGDFTSDPRHYPANDHRQHNHTPISHKVQVQEIDLNPITHPGARYFAEGFYVAPHEYLQGNGNQNNNVAHVEVLVAGPNGAGQYDYTDVWPYQSESPAVDAWTGASQSMIEPTPLADGRAFVAWEVTDLGGGQWHYEYAVYNMNLDASIGTFCVPLASGTNVTNIGFHAPLNHAPELHADNYTNDPWTPTLTAQAMQWQTSSFASNPLANAVRFGTLYNFRFDADIAPQSIQGVAGLFKTGGLTTVALQGPSPSTPLSDINLNSIPDVCEPAFPSAVQADSGVAKARFVSFVVPSAAVAAAGDTALRVKLVSLHHVEPPYTGGPSAPFTSFEGQIRWVGSPAQYMESSSTAIPMMAAALQCTPHYRDWSTIGLLHVSGSAIVPSSVYEVSHVAASCLGIESTCTAASAPLTVTTTRWGDVELPYNPPDPTAQPNIADVTAMVNKFRSTEGAPIKARVLIAGSDEFGNFSATTLGNDFDFSHIAACVDAFRGRPYPYTIAACP